jgi:subtilisin family serine protease
MTDYNGHGTAVASVAGGITQGVASGANLVIIKFRNAATSPRIGKLQLRGVTAAALRDAWDHSINDIIDRRNGGDTGKFIINMSYGEIYTPKKLDSTIRTDARVRIPTWNTSARAHRAGHEPGHPLCPRTRHHRRHSHGQRRAE